MRTLGCLELASLLVGQTFVLGVRADDRIHVFVNQKGRVVFTNLVDNTSLPSPDLATLTGTDPDGGGSLESLVARISSRHTVDPLLVRAIICVESDFNRRAVSPRGALGLMQLLPETGRRFGVHDFFDPGQNIEGGVRYLRSLLNMFDGNLDLSLAAYNAGENRVGRLGRVPEIAETKNYVRKVRSLYRRSSSGRAPSPSTTVEPLGRAARRSSTETERVRTKPAHPGFTALSTDGVWCTSRMSTHNSDSTLAFGLCRALPFGMPSLGVDADA